MFVVFQSIGDRKVMTPAAAMSSAANVVRSLIFVAIFKILNVKKIFEFNKILSYSTPYSFLTTPFILSIVFALSEEFDFTIMAFEKPPVLSVLYLTIITPFWLGRIGSWGQDGTVQPQEENADVITRGSSPTFVNSNAHSPSEPLVIVS